MNEFNRNNSVTNSRANLNHLNNPILIDDYSDIWTPTTANIGKQNNNHK